ncbi:MAG: hypothetical protein A3C55_05125 [Gammaproteobacteria bacterium RIFCSPHIGHO2_02_FULL_42_13]|nr:MAG: hypothetical protein A3C55_05125 [Gammaproteobacteria bacterium RIFCSPHIGHO2_02_FULL_42_13]OGT70067.1 MAG: hypothetical protein A3H43_00030 [Gammaproteobacteria bacterium RIFCSPLOWO2_02_FULL_42_9]HLB57637.1 hypothetical protein [Gammaproteobacteria bacterium]
MKYNDLIAENKRKLEKAIKHLAYSYDKIQKLPVSTAEMDDETLEIWESFAARFSRVTDIFLTKYVRVMVLANDPGFSGSLRDFVNQGEKLALIDDANAWMAIRELRNITAHDYTEEDLLGFFKRLKSECPRLLAIRL